MLESLTQTPLPVKRLKPDLKSVVVRNRLFEQLDKAFLRDRIVWVYAPAGFGKTTLAAGYADHDCCPVLWYCYDQGDCDPAYFFEHFAAAAQTVFPGFATPVAFRPEYSVNIEAFARQFFRTVMTDGGVKKFVVLDDFHAVQNESFALTTAITLAQESPASCRLLILSRSEPPPKYISALYATLNIFPADFLAFSENEAVQLAELMAYDHRSPDWTEVLQQCQGWVAALVINLRHRAHRQTVANKQLRPLAQIALSGLEYKIQQQLIMLALPKTITEVLAVELTGETDVKRTLAQLADDNYLVSRVNGDVATYEIHPLLRGFLADRQREQLNEADYAEFLVRTSALLERHGQIDQAAEILIQGSQWQELQRLILTHAKAELTAGRSIRLLAWINALPEHLERSPWLDFWQGTASLALNPKQGQSLFKRSYEKFGQEPLGRAITAAGIVTAMFVAFDDFTGMRHWVDELADLDGFVSTLADPEVEAWILGCGNFLVFFDFHAELLSKWQKRSLQLMKTCPPHKQVYLATFLLPYYVLQGEIENCQTVLALLQNNKPSNDPLDQINLLNWSVVVAYLAGDFATAYRQTEQAQTLADTYGLVFLKSFNYGHEVYAALYCRDFSKAATALQNMETFLVHERRLDVTFFFHVRSGLEFLQNNLGQARKDAEFALELNLQLKIFSTRLLIQQVLAQILIGLNEIPLAFSHLDQVDDFCRRTGKFLLYFTSLLIRAYGLLTVGDETDAVQVLASALTLGNQHNYLNLAHPFWQPRAMSQLCQFALTHNIEPDYVRRLIVALNLEPSNGASENWPWPLKIRTLGNFRVDTKDAVRLKINQKETKPLELLKWLIAFNPDGTARQTLADVLWPDADADTALHAFEVNLQRLRKLIGVKNALLLHGSTLSINRNLCWLDIWTLDDVLRLLDCGNTNTVLAERLLQVWRGSFMLGFDHPLIQTKRDLFAAKFIRAMDKLGLLLETAGQMQAAVDCYSRALEIEPLAETMHYRLISCLKNAGRQSEAVLAYRRCCRIYLNQVGITISKGLQQLGESL